MLIARFDGQLLYASSDEGDRLTGALNDLSGQFPHLFWKISESSLVFEFKRQTSGVRQDDKIQHFCFMSCNQCVDVLSFDEPLWEGAD